MKTYFRAIAPVAAVAFALSVSNHAVAQSNDNAQQDGQNQAIEQNSDRNRASNDQEQSTCPICGLTVEKAENGADGLKVVKVKSGSPADNAGIREGDVVVSVADQNIDSVDTLKTTMSQQQQRSDAANVQVRLRRDDRQRQVTLNLNDGNQGKSNDTSANSRMRDDRQQSNRDRARGNRDQDRRQSDRVANEGTQRDLRPGVAGSSDQINRQSNIEHASLGVTLDQSWQGRGAGVRVASVYTNSPAHQAGLKTGDRILKVNGNDVSTSQDLIRQIDEMDPDDRADFTVVADGQKEELDIQLGSRAETIQGAMVGNNGIQGGQISGNVLGQRNATNQSLNQTLTEIQRELRQLRQRVDAMDGNNQDAGARDNNQNARETGRDANAQNRNADNRNQDATRNQNDRAEDIRAADDGSDDAANADRK